MAGSQIYLLYTRIRRGGPGIGRVWDTSVCGHVHISHGARVLSHRHRRRGWCSGGLVGSVIEVSQAAAATTCEPTELGLMNGILPFLSSAYEKLLLLRSLSAGPAGEPCSSSSVVALPIPGHVVSRCADLPPCSYAALSADGRDTLDGDVGDGYHRVTSMVSVRHPAVMPAGPLAWQTIGYADATIASIIVTHIGEDVYIYIGNSARLHARLKRSGALVASKVYMYTHVYMYMRWNIWKELWRARAGACLCAHGPSRVRCAHICLDKRDEQIKSNDL